MTNDETIAELKRLMNVAETRGLTDEEEHQRLTASNFANLILEAGQLASKQGLPTELVIQVYIMRLGKIMHEVFPTPLNRLAALILACEELTKYVMEG